MQHETYKDFQSLTYHYIRTLIYRPFVCTDYDDRASASVVAVSSSSKHIVQIIQLLDERHLSFSHCFNKTELVLVAGFGLMLQTLDLRQNSKLLQDIQRILVDVISMLENMSAHGANQFKRLGCSLLAVRRSSEEGAGYHAAHRAPSESSSLSSESLHKRKGFMDIARRYTLAAGLSTTTDSDPSPIEIRKRLGRSTMPTNSGSPSQLSNSPEIATKSESVTPPYRQNSKACASTPNLNLDYFSFSNSSNPPMARTPGQSSRLRSRASLDNTLEALEGPRQKQHHDLQSLYDWQNLDDFFTTQEEFATAVDATEDTSLLDSWDFTGLTPGADNDLTPCAPATKHSNEPVPAAATHKHDADRAKSPKKAAKPSSVQSFSTDSMTSGEEFSSIDTAPSAERDAAIEALFNDIQPLPSEPVAAESAAA